MRCHGCPPESACASSVFASSMATGTFGVLDCFGYSLQHDIRVAGIQALAPHHFD